MRTESRRPVASLDELVGQATSREPMKNADSLSGSALERVVIGGESFVLKHLHVDDDWIQRVSGDIIPRPLVMWTSGLFDTLPDSIDHTVVEAAGGLGRNQWGAGILMRDVGEWMFPVTAGGVIPMDQHVRFLSHMADLHATFWGFDDPVGLMSMGNRYRLLTPQMATLEASRATEDPVPPLVADGWPRFASEAPRAAEVILPLLDDPWPLFGALESGPQTLVHSDWKLGNLGSHPDGRTILIDWAFPGRAPATVDLAWYLAVNCDLLPHSKEETIEVYRHELESRGISTGGWWEPMLELALLGGLLHMGWSKTGAELEWWTNRIERATQFLAFTAPA